MAAARRQHGCAARWSVVADRLRRAERKRLRPRVPITDVPQLLLGQRLRLDRRAACHVAAADVQRQRRQ